MTAEEIMTPRVVVTAIEASASLGSVIERIADSPHSRLLLYRESLDTIVGVALRGQLLAEFARGESQKTLEQLARPARFVDESTRADDLLRLFQESEEHLVIVLDEYGGTSGVVTLEDVVELVTGDIRDETDRAVDVKEAARRRRERLLRESGGTVEDHSE
jgi:CBS domain containing-hemolysin-like protein